MTESYILSVGDSREVLKTAIIDESVDMVITSPPYDNLRTYNNKDAWCFDTFKTIAQELVRVLAPGGVIVWVVADATIDGSETGSSFRQALYFMELGLKLHDTMIYNKENYVPLTHNRYEQCWEYMFCFSKGKPRTFNPIKEKCKYGGSECWGKPSFYKTNNGELVESQRKPIGDFKIKNNIFTYRTGSTQNQLDAYGETTHPAIFPYKLAVDQIKSWTNEGDWVLDPFMGSGTSGIACAELGRNFVGIELNPKYFAEADKRISNAYRYFGNKVPKML